MIYGHGKVLDEFTILLRGCRLPSSLILQGEQGIGKSKVALRMAELVLSDHGMPDSALFNRMIKGAHADFLYLKREVNEKSGNLAKDISAIQVRKVIDFYRKKPSEGKWRVVVIDSADDLNKSSANALLKVIEEPPRNTITIFINHSPAKLLPTIRSRSQCISLGKLSDAEMDDFIKGNFPHISERDKEFVISLSQGNPGVATKMISLNGIEMYEHICNSMLNKDFSLVDRYSSRDISADEYDLFRQLLLKLLERQINYLVDNSLGDNGCEQNLLPSNHNWLTKLEHSYFSAHHRAGSLDSKKVIIKRVDKYNSLQKLLLEEKQFTMDRKQVITNCISIMH